MSYIKSLRGGQEHKEFGHKKILEIAKLKACQEYPSFLDFLKHSLDTKQ